MDQLILDGKVIAEVKPCEIRSEGAGLFEFVLRVDGRCCFHGSLCDLSMKLPDDVSSQLVIGKMYTIKYSLNDVGE